MKKIMGILGMLIAFQASAEVMGVAVCGQYRILKQKRFFIVQKGNLEPDSYEIFASNHRSATKLESMKNRKDYCIRGLYDLNRPTEGISLIQITK